MKTTKNYSKVINYTDNVIYDNNDVTIIKELNKKLFFHIKTNKYYSETYNVAEAVAILMKIKKINNDNIWNITLSEEDKNIESTYTTLLWLTGGLKNWDLMKLDWLDYYEILNYEYSYQIKNILKMSKTLNDVRILFKNMLNFDKLYSTILKYSI